MQNTIRYLALKHTSSYCLAIQLSNLPVCSHTVGFFQKCGTDKKNRKVSAVGYAVSCVVITCTAAATPIYIYVSVGYSVGRYRNNYFGCTRMTCVCIRRGSRGCTPLCRPWKGGNGDPHHGQCSPGQRAQCSALRSARESSCS